MMSEAEEKALQDSISSDSTLNVEPSPRQDATPSQTAQQMIRDDDDDVGLSSVAQPRSGDDDDDDDGGDDDESPRQPIPERVSLFRLSGVEVFASRTDQESQPWHLPVDGLVIPVGVKGGMYGGLAQALRAEVGDQLWNVLRERIQSSARSGIDPDEPIYVDLDDSELGPAILPNAPDIAVAEETASTEPRTRYSVIAATVGNVDDVQAIQAIAAAVVRQAASNGIKQLAFPSLGTGRGPFRDQSELVAEYMVRGVYDALSTFPVGAMTEITLTTRDQGALETMQQKANLLINNLAQSFRNDQPRGPDLLGIQAEVDALAETLLLQGVEPPLAVGILGGWGSGKSFVMNLMRQRMIEIRAQASPGWPSDPTGVPDMPFVGHVYQIDFNAWTYAKSNLWASLMQTIFYELNRQLTLEQQLALKVAEIELEGQEATVSEGEGGDQEARKAELKRSALLTEGDLWRVLYAMGDEERRLLVGTDVGRAVLEKWRKGDIPADALWQRLQEQAQEETEALQTIQRELAGAQEQLAKETRRAAEQAVWTPTLDKLRGIVAASLLQELQDELGKEDADVLVELSRLAPGIRNALKAVRQRPWEAIPFLLFAIAVLITPWLQTQLALWRWPSVLVSVGATVAAWARVAVRWHDTMNQIREEYRTDLQAEQARLEAGGAPRFRNKEIAELEKTVADLEGQAKRQQQRVGLTAEYVSLYDFVRSRLDEGFYEKRLGLMHRVQRDLQELTDALIVRPQDRYVQQKRDLFPRGPARVVLYIDDLDRCPPRRVVEVLEAVQLLLKTDLFIVVLGLDTRYVTRALEKAYVDILQSQGDPSGLDYIEKILQIPYRVRPVQPNAVRQFLSSQMDVLSDQPQQASVTPPQPEGPVGGAGSAQRREPRPEAQRRIQKLDLPPAVIAFTSEEYGAIEEVCQRTRLTPRGLKRIANVMKLIKIFWHRTDESKPVNVVKAVVSLLALSARYPEIMRDAFTQLEARYRIEFTKPVGDSQTFSDFFLSFIDGYASKNLHLMQHQDDFGADVDAMLPAETTLEDVGVRSFQLARSFSFVGDPAISFAPPQRVELVNDLQTG